MKMNKILDPIAEFFRRLFEKDFVVKIISILAAVLIWFIVSINEYPTISRVFYNVPVMVEMQGTYAEAHNFQVVEQKISSANVYISGDRGEIGNLEKEDITIVASAENVINATSYNLPIDVVSSSGREFMVTNIANADTGENISHVNVKFDEIITREISVKPKMDNVKIAAGYISDADDVVIIPDKILVTGAKENVSKITDAYVYVESPGELSSTYEYMASNPVLYNGSTPVSDVSTISIDRTSFTVQVPVLQKQVLPLEVRITNAPAGFDTDAFIEKLKMSVSELEVAAQKEFIKEIKALDIGSIDMREVNIGSEFKFNTSEFLPDGYQNLSEVNTVTVTCPTENLFSLTMAIRGSAVQIINAPPQFDYNIITSGFTMNFIGSQESLEQLTYFDVIAQIDLINYELEERDYKFPVTFSTPNFSDVWCIGSEGVLSPKATVTVTLKPDNER